MWLEPTYFRCARIPGLKTEIADGLEVAGHELLAKAVEIELIDRVFGAEFVDDIRTVNLDGPRTHVKLLQKRDPTNDVVHLVDNTKHFRTLVGPRSARM